MTESAALLKAICQQPDDDAPRLIFADRLDEHNESGRASWIRWQIANLTRTVTLSIDHERKRTINDMTIAPEFVELVPSMLESKFPAGSYEFTRGFVSAVTMRQAVFVRHLRRLFNAHPITRARLIDRQPLHTRNPKDLSSLWGWSRSDGPAAVVNLDAINSAIFERLPNGVQREGGANRRYFSSENEAIKILESACVRFGRSVAKLPKLKRED